MDSGSDVHQYLENELRDYYYRDENSLIRATAEATTLVGEEPEGGEAPAVHMSENERRVFAVIAGPDERAESVVSVLHSVREEFDSPETEAADVRRRSRRSSARVSSKSNTGRSRRTNSPSPRRSQRRGRLSPKPSRSPFSALSLPAFFEHVPDSRPGTSLQRPPLLSPRWRLGLVLRTRAGALRGGLLAPLRAAVRDVAVVGPIHGEVPAVWPHRVEVRPPAALVGPFGDFESLLGLPLGVHVLEGRRGLVELAAARALGDTGAGAVRVQRARVPLDGRLAAAEREDAGLYGHLLEERALDALAVALGRQPHLVGE